MFPTSIRGSTQVASCPGSHLICVILQGLLHFLGGCVSYGATQSAVLGRLGQSNPDCLNKNSGTRGWGERQNGTISSILLSYYKELTANGIQIIILGGVRKRSNQAYRGVEVISALESLALQNLWHTTLVKVSSPIHVVADPVTNSHLRGA